MRALEYDTESLTDAVIARLDECKDPRFKQIMTSLVRHLHDFVRDVDLQGDEWFKAIEFLTACGKACNDKRQEFILLSDTLGVSMLVVALAHAKAQQGHQGATPADRSDGARSVLLGRRAGDAAGQRHRSRCGRRERAVQRPRDGPRRQTACRRAARRLVRRWRRCVRHADGGRRHARPRPHPHRRARPLLVLVDPSHLLPGAHRRPGRAPCSIAWAGTRIARGTCT